MVIGLLGCQTASQQVAEVELASVEGLLSISGRATGTFRFTLKRETPVTDRLVLKSRLGLKMGEALFEGGQMRWLRAGDEVLSPEAARQYLEETLSLDLPFQALPHWLRGMPFDPSTTVMNSGFSELGWSLQNESIDGGEYVRRFTLVKDDVRVKVIQKERF